MISTFQIWLNNQFIDLKNELLINTLSIQARCDTAFASGSCQVITDKLAYNIPSNTYCEVEGDLFLISSVAKKHPNIPGLYIHECKLLEITALLETYALGSKTFSLESGKCADDGDRVDVICELMSEKYNINFSTRIGMDYSIFGNHEYTFGAGTTMFAALSEIALRNGYKVIVADIGHDSMDGHLSDVIIDFVSLTEHTTASLQNIVDFRYIQEDGNYCKYLETEAQNVVDRGSTQIWRDLTCRSQGPAIDADNACVTLPSNVEAITEYKVYGDMRIDNLNINLDNFKNIITVQWMLDNGAVQDQTGYVISGTFADLKDLPNPIHSVMVNLERHLDWVSQVALFKLRRETPSPDTTYVYISATTFQSGGTYYRYEGYIDATERLREEASWNLLGASDKPKYAVYKTGGNLIYNLNATYKYDFWGAILGISSGNYLSYDKDLSYDDTLSGYTYHVNLVISTYDDNPVNKTYSVKAIAMTKPKIIVSKQNNPINESNWKEATRTYTNSANTINLDALCEDMVQKVEPLGCLEAVVNCDTTGISHALPNNKVTFNSKTWYINSIENTYKGARRYTQYNLSSQPLKIADAIGVDYQFNPIRLPYYSIIDRPIFLEDTSLLMWDMITTSLNHDKSVLVTFKTGIRDFTLRASVMNLESQEAYVLYCECADNFSCGDYAIYNSANKYENRACPYGDNYNEIDSIQVTVYAMTEELSRSTSLEMPNVLDSVISALPTYGMLRFPQMKIFKDGRERLTFTIKINKN